MGGGGGGSILSDVTGGAIGDNSVITKIGNSASRTVSGGSYSFDGRGYTQTGKFNEGVSGMMGADHFTNDYYDAKKMGVQLAKNAKDQAAADEAKLLGAAKQKADDEVVTKSAMEILAKRKALQDKKSKGKGRQSTIVTGTAEGEQNLGTISTSNAVLGL